MDTIQQDVRFALRGLARRPAFAAVALLTLVVGIGANAAMFSVVHWVVLRALPYDDPDALVRIRWSTRTFNQRLVAFYRDNAASYEDLAAYSGWAFTLTGDGGPLEVNGPQVTTNYFDVVGVSPVLGRSFTAEEGRPGRSDVAVLSHGLWMSHFGGDRDVVGRRIDLSGAGRDGVTVIGVLPADHAPIEAGAAWDVWIPLEAATDLANDDSWFLAVVARLRPGASVEQARAESRRLARRIAEELYPRTSDDALAGGGVERLAEAIVGSETRGRLWAFAGAVAVVLVAACTNVASLLLARSGARSREIAVRGALGASRSRVVRLLLTESLVLAALGGILGALVAYALVPALAQSLSGMLPRVVGIRLDPSVLAVTLGLSLASGLVFGLAPALRATGWNLVGRLRRSDPVGGEPGGGNGWLIVAEVALSVALVAAAALVLESFWRLSSVDPGFEPEGALVVGVYTPDGDYPEAEPKRQFYRRLWARLESLPGVEAAGSIHLLPMAAGNWNFSYYPEGLDLGERDAPPQANFRVIGAGYLRALEIPLTRGRPLTEADRDDAAPVGLVNESFARRTWPGEDPVGKEVRIFSPGGPVFTVVGVVGDVRQHALASDAEPEMYRPLEQWTLGRNFVLVRAASGVAPASLGPSVREAIGSIDPGVPIFRMSPMSEVVAASLARERLTARLLASFAGMTLFLAAVGVYGVTSHVVGRRSREMGLRIALGARRSQVLAAVLVRGMLPVALGTGLGLLGAATLGGAWSSLIYDATSSPRAAVFTVVAVGLALTGLAACYVPARRASRVDPMTALRFE